MRLPVNIGLTSVGLLLTAAAVAQDAPRTTPLPGVSVEATLPPLEEERLKETIPSASVTRKQFESQPNDLRVNDIAKRMPGLYTGGAPGEDKDARLRGLD